jgi:hypothetical protein
VQLLLHVKYKPDLRAVVGSKHPGDGIAKVKAARKQPFLLSFSYVCPVTVLVKRSFLVSNVGEKVVSYLIQGAWSNV